MIVLLIISFIGIGIYEVPGLVRKKYWYELIVLLIFLLIAFILSLLKVQGVKVPGLLKGIEAVKSFFSS